MVRWLSGPEQQAWRAYIEASAVVGDALDAQLQRDAGMPHAYYELLVRLSEAPQRSMRMSGLATATKSSRSRLSHAVAALERRGWVRRDPVPTDRRGQVAVLTDEGFGALEQAAAGHVGAVRDVLVDALSAEQVDQLRQICQAVLARRA